MTVGSLEGFMLDRGFLTSAELSKAQQVCTETGERLVTAVRRLGIMAGSDLARAVATYYALPTVGEQDWPKTTLLSDVLSPRYLREHKVLPLAVDGQRLVLAAADPGHTAAINAIQLAAGRTIELRVAPAEDIDAAIDRFRPAEEAPVAAELPAGGGGENDDDVEHLKDLALGAPVVRFVNQLLLDGLNSRATDIHIEPFRGKLNIRLRIDGMLTEARSAPAHMARAIVSRVKILSGLDIAERRLPQDGRARVKIESRTLDLRIATMPTIHGEAVAVRLLENVQRVLELGKLGFTESDEKTLRKHLAAPHGLMLVTGPTGSGKTTTLAAALTILNEPHRKILTIEDPIEYQLEGINQTQAKPEIGIGFANALRHFLRHDPDVIMVGEMRDAETAAIAVHASLTGHLVLSTLHTNSAAGAITRLLDMAGGRLPAGLVPELRGRPAAGAGAVPQLPGAGRGADRLSSRAAAAGRPDGECAALAAARLRPLQRLGLPRPHEHRRGARDQRRDPPPDAARRRARADRGSRREGRHEHHGARRPAQMRRGPHHAGRGAAVTLEG